MPDFLFQIKARSDYETWAWPPLFSDLITAENIKKAKEQVHELFGVKFPGRIAADEITKGSVILFVKEIKEDNSHVRSWFIERECQQCNRRYRMIDGYQLSEHSGVSQTHCSSECSRERYEVERLRKGFDDTLSGKSVPVIYRVYNKATQMNYIGKTTQVFTLRWYQHFYQGTGTKFHEAIKQHNLWDWLFEVVEVVKIPEEMKNIQEVNDLIFSREMYWINHYNSIFNGYNTTPSKADELITLEDKLQGKLFEKENITNLAV